MDLVSWILLNFGNVQWIRLAVPQMFNELINRTLSWTILMFLSCQRVHQEAQIKFFQRAFFSSLKGDDLRVYKTVAVVGPLVWPWSSQKSEECCPQNFITKTHSTRRCPCVSVSFLQNSFYHAIIWFFVIIFVFLKRKCRSAERFLMSKNLELQDLRKSQVAETSSLPSSNVDELHQEISVRSTFNICVLCNICANKFTITPVKVCWRFFINSIIHEEIQEKESS